MNEAQLITFRIEHYKNRLQAIKQATIIRERNVLLDQKTVEKPTIVHLSTNLYHSEILKLPPFVETTCNKIVHKMGEGIVAH